MVVSSVLLQFTAKAPMMAPNRLPRPPMATQATASIELSGENSPGLMMPTWGTYSAPATPASMAEITKTNSLYWATW